MIVQQIVEQIEKNQRFLVVAHENPDGDAIGSTLGLALALKAMGKEVTAFNADTVPETMTFLPESEIFCHQLAETEMYDVAFVLDAGDVERSGLPLRQRCRILINIDHHPYSTFGDICYVDTSASATAILIYRILNACQFQLNLNIAKALYLAILADTGSFRYSSVNEETFTVAGQLIGLGVDPWEMASNLYESYAPERMRLLGYILPTLEISDCGRYASVAMSQEMLVQAGATEEHAEGFVNYPRAIRGVEVALFFNQFSKDHYKVSFRSRGTIDVGSLARQLGGGGHHNAAGAKIKGSLGFARSLVAQHLDQLFS
ncbi:MAG: bifunctional oligoribonuclease/PAP phosphatase NrnA [Deltaproteobacteria bacterium]|jgi:phosphoesterase RecJ-like protein|nr:bifunctional oligoribonuclease/PAP phosphatase NrnA [Deltaproteobacteria bacterium]MCW8893489.1 bifunctional oligoribonuclease/PAP phosphatase NrnA [Deltaproteobacteria bacterium]MCW9050401.1 bifunctional oligoribonuclease/PAP phosphatase NrnA [Deltaproteobacteria bacterium]